MYSPRLPDALPPRLSQVRAAAASPNGTAVAMPSSPFFIPVGAASTPPPQTGGHTGGLPCPGGTEKQWASEHLAACRHPWRVAADGGNCSDAAAFGAPEALRAYTAVQLAEQAPAGSRK